MTKHIYHCSEIPKSPFKLSRYLSPIHLDEAICIGDHSWICNINLLLDFKVRPSMPELNAHPQPPPPIPLPAKGSVHFRNPITRIREKGYDGSLFVNCHTPPLSYWLFVHTSRFIYGLYGYIHLKSLLMEYDILRLHILIYTEKIGMHLILALSFEFNVFLRL